MGGPKRRRYKGESAFPFILQNLHRYFLYFATIVLGFLAYDAVRSFFFRHADGSLHFGIGLGSLVLTANVVLLSLFTSGCNSLRHLIGGKLDCFTCSLSARTRHKLWRRVSWMNAAPCGGPGSASSASASPISTSGSRRWASSTIKALLGGRGGIRGSRVRRDRDRRGRRGPARRDRVLGERREDGADLQVAARQGAHRDGGGRRRGGLGNVEAADNWQTHFQDTLFGGKYLNNWRMAELHAKVGPVRTRSRNSE